MICKRYCEYRTIVNTSNNSWICIVANKLRNNRNRDQFILVDPMLGQVIFGWDKQYVSLVCPWATIRKSFTSSPASGNKIDIRPIRLQRNTFGIVGFHPRDLRP